MSISLHRKLIAFFLSLYLVATWSSMAGMELFGWLTFLLSISYAIRAPADSEVKLSNFDENLPWRTMIAIPLATAIGIFLNGIPEADKTFVIGTQRWVFLLVSHSVALTLCPPRLKGYRFFLGFTSLVAVYAVFQSFTGIDLLRMWGPEPNRAVQRLPVESALPLWRSAGLFGSPMHYAYVAGQYACLPLAVFFVFPKASQRLRQLSLAAFCLIATSLLTTYVRGAWIAMACAYLAMAFMVKRKYFYGAMASLFVSVGALLAAVPHFRARFVQIFDMANQSNSDRWLLWKANWLMFLDYPVLGVGYSVNEDRSGEYLTRMGFPHAFTGHAHNTYLQWLAGLGLVGLALYLFFIGFFLRMTWKLYRSLPEAAYFPRALTLAALGAQIHVHVGGLTEANFRAGATNHNMMVTFALVVSIKLLASKGLLGRYETAA